MITRHARSVSKLLADRIVPYSVAQAWHGLDRRDAHSAASVSGAAFAHVGTSALRPSTATCNPAETSFVRRIQTSARAHAIAQNTAMDIFDRDLKRMHRDRAALMQDPDDPFLGAVVDRLLDRLEDCNRDFPIAAVIGGAGEHVVKRLRGGRAGVREVVLLDTSAPMLERARRQEAEARLAGCSEADSWPKVHYIQADEEYLPLQEKCVDVVILPLGIHWVNDLPGALAQARRALRPDGLLLAALLGGDTLQELRIACSLAEQEHEGGVSSRVSPMAQVRDAGNLLTRAGLAIPAVDVDNLVVRYPSAAQLVGHLREMGESNAVKTRRGTLRRDTALAAAAMYQSMFGDEDGSIPATYQVLFMTGWSPHDSQQRPASRGSATVSFQDLEETVRSKADGPEN